MQRWNNLLFEYNFVLKEKIKIQTYSKNEIPLKVTREETDYLKKWQHDDRKFLICNNHKL